MKNSSSMRFLVIILSLNVLALNVFSMDLVHKKTKRKNILDAKTFMFQRISHTDGPYDNAIGINASLNSGITYKHFIADDKAFEIDLGSRWKGGSVTGILEMCIAAGSVGPGLIWNFGLGPRFGFYNGKNYMDYLGVNREDRTYSLIGFVGTIGFEYFFEKIPFTVGLDYRPYFDLKGQGDESFSDGALTIRYVF